MVDPKKVDEVLGLLRDHRKIPFISAELEKQRLTDPEILLIIEAAEQEMENSGWEKKRGRWFSKPLTITADAIVSPDELPNDAIPTEPAPDYRPRKDGRIYLLDENGNGLRYRRTSRLHSGMHLALVQQAIPIEEEDTSRIQIPIQQVTTIKAGEIPPTGHRAPSQEMSMPKKREISFTGYGDQARRSFRDNFSLENIFEIGFAAAAVLAIGYFGRDPLTDLYSKTFHSRSQPGEILLPSDPIQESPTPLDLEEKIFTYMEGNPDDHSDDTLKIDFTLQGVGTSQYVAAMSTRGWNTQAFSELAQLPLTEQEALVREANFTYIIGLAPEDREKIIDRTKAILDDPKNSLAVEMKDFSSKGIKDGRKNVIQLNDSLVLSLSRDARIENTETEETFDENINPYIRPQQESAQVTTIPLVGIDALLLPQSVKEYFNLWEIILENYGENPGQARDTLRSIADKITGDYDLWTPLLGINLNPLPKPVRLALAVDLGDIPEEKIFGIVNAGFERTQQGYITESDLNGAKMQDNIYTQTVRTETTTLEFILRTYRQNSEAIEDTKELSNLYFTVRELEENDALIGAVSSGELLGQLVTEYKKGSNLDIQNLDKEKRRILAAQLYSSPEFVDKRLGNYMDREALEQMLNPEGAEPLSVKEMREAGKEYFGQTRREAQNIARGLRRREVFSLYSAEKAKDKSLTPYKFSHREDVQESLNMKPSTINRDVIFGLQI